MEIQPNLRICSVCTFLLSSEEMYLIAHEISLFNEAKLFGLDMKQVLSQVNTNQCLEVEVKLSSFVVESEVCSWHRLWHLLSLGLQLQLQQFLLLPLR